MNESDTELSRNLAMTEKQPLPETGDMQHSHHDEQRHYRWYKQ